MTDNDPILSPLVPGEIGIARQIHGIFQQAYRAEALLIGTQELVFPPLQRAETDIAKSTACFTGLISNEVLVAVIEVSSHWNEVSIDSLAILPAFFSRGFASRLIDDVLLCFPDRDIVVETAHRNEPAIKLYEKHGFSRKGGRNTHDGFSLVTLAYRSTPRI